MNYDYKAPDFETTMSYINRAHEMRGKFWREVFAKDREPNRVSRGASMSTVDHLAAACGPRPGAAGRRRL